MRYKIANEEKKDDTVTLEFKTNVEGYPSVYASMNGVAEKLILSFVRNRIWTHGDIPEAFGFRLTYKGEVETV